MLTFDRGIIELTLIGYIIHFTIIVIIIYVTLLFRQGKSIRFMHLFNGIDAINIKIMINRY